MSWARRGFGWLAVAILTLTAVAGCQQGEERTADVPVSPGLALGGESGGFEQAEAVRTFEFPADHGPHPGYRNEWWYLAGELRDDAGHRYGFNVTFFRTGLTPDSPDRDSAWATRQLWMAHAALTDVAAGEHTAVQRFSRGAPGLAGAGAEPVRVWLENWQLALPDGEHWSLTLPGEEFVLELELSAQKPVVLQGQQGLSRKNQQPGKASYYYSLTRLEAQGTLSRGDKTTAVSGRAWIDREWSTSALEQDQVGWDWFALQLDTEEELMYYRLRNRQGEAHPGSQGSWVAADGDKRIIAPDEIRLTPLAWWQSDDGRRYPVRWRLEYPPECADWVLEAVLPDQHMDLAVVYWEGLVDVRDRDSGRHLGSGYLEMTGY